MSNESDIQAVQRTFEMILPMADTFAAMFYDRFFAQEPEARSLFATDMTAQREKVMDMLSLAVRSLNEPTAIQQELHELGDRHIEYRVDMRYYTVMNEAILAALQDCLGTRFTADMHLAWEHALIYLAEKMQAAYSGGKT